MTIYTDDFNRSSLGTTGPAGGSYINPDGWAIDSSLYLEPPNVGANFTFLLEDFGFSNLAIDLDVTPDGYASGSANCGIVVRYTDDDNWWRLVPQGDTIYLERMVAGVGPSTVASHNCGTGVTTIRLECDGSEFRIYTDGFLWGSYLDLSGHNTTATKHGVVAYNGVLRRDNLVVNTVSFHPRWYTGGVLVSGGTLTPTPPPVEIEIPGVGGPNRSAVAYAARVLVEGTTDPDLVVELFTRDDLHDPVVRFEDSFQRKFTDQLNEAGAGSFKCQNDDLALASFLTSGGDLARFTYRGVPALLVVCEDFDRVTVSQDEEVEECTTVGGPGHLSLLSKARLYPVRGVGSLPVQEDILFNFTHVLYDDSWWGPVNDFGLYGDPTFVNWQTDDLAPLPEDWPDGAAHHIGPQAGSPAHAPSGFWYGRRAFTVPTTGHYVIVGAGDNQLRMWIDGSLVLTSDGWRQASVVELDLTAGEHTLAFEVGNEPITPTDNPTMCIYTIAAFAGGSMGTVIARSDGSEKIVEYPPNGAPGMTPGEAVLIALQDADERDALPFVTVAFDEHADSEGTPWQVVGDIATKVGTDYLTFLRELSATYIDFWMDPGSYTLHLWHKDARGVDAAAEFLRFPDDPDDPNTGNIAELATQATNGIINALLIRWSGGWAEVIDEASVALFGRREALLGLGAVQSIGEVNRIGQEHLALFGQIREQIDLSPEPRFGVDDDYPYVSYDVGDRITVPDAAGDPILERVIEITVTEDEEGNAILDYVLKDLVLEDQERHEQALKKFSDGTGRGDFKQATPVALITAGGPTCCPPQPASPPG